MIFEFFENHLDYITFLYGFSYIIFAVIAFLLKDKKRTNLKWWLLALFALSCGVDGITGLLSFLYADTAFFQSVRAVLSLLSYIALLEFARLSARSYGIRLFDPVLYLLLLSVCAMGGLFGSDGFISMARVSMGFPGALLTAWMIFKEHKEKEGASRPLAWLGWMFVLYAAASLLVAADHDLWFLPVPSSEWILPMVAFYAQLLRGLVAVGAAASIRAYFSDNASDILEGEYQGSRFEHYSVGVLLFAVLLSGWFLTELVSSNFTMIMKNDLRTKTQAVASALDWKLLADMASTSETASVSGQALSEQLTKIASSQRLKTCLSVIAMDRDGFREVSDKEHSGCRSITGHERPQKLDRITTLLVLDSLFNGKASIKGPYLKNGKPFIDSIAPVKLGDGGSVSFLMSIDASEWMRWVSLVRLVSIYTVALVAVVILFFYGLLQTNRLTRLKIAVSESRYKSLVDGSPNMVFSVDLLGVITSVNKAALKELGLYEHELIGSKFLDVWQENDRSLIAPYIERAVKLDKVTFETTLLKRDRSMLEAIAVFNPIIGSDGNVRNFVAILTDITKRKEAEYSLKQKTKRLSILSHVSSMINKSEKLDQLLNGILNSTVNMLDFDGGCIHLLGQDGRSAELKACVDLDQGYLRARKEISLSTPPYSHVFLSGDPLFEGAACSDQFASASGKSAMAVIPLYAKASVVGILSMFSRKVYSFADEDKNILLAIGREAGTAVEKMRIEDSLNERRAQQQAILDNMPSRAWLKDIDGKYISVNTQFAKALGLSPEKIIGRKDKDLYEGQYAERAAKDDALVISSRAQRSMEEMVPLPSGNIWFETFKAPIFDQKGSVIGITGLSRDISRRRKNEESVKKLAAIVSFSDDAIMGLDMNGTITSWNQGAERTYGFTSEDIVGLSFTELFEKGNEVQYFDLLRKVKKGQHVEKFETIHVSKSGKIFDASVSMSPISNSDGKVVAISVISRDITESKRAEENLKRAEAKSRGIIAAIPDLMFQLDPSGVFTDYRPSAQSEMNLPSKYFLGKSIKDVFPRSLAEKTVAAMDRAKKTGEVQTMEYELSGEGGSQQYYEGRVAVSGTGDFLVIVRNITSRKRAEEENRIKSEQIEKQLEEIQRLYKIKSEFTSTVSHELRTPLTSIKEGIGIVLDGSAGAINEDQKNFLSIAKRNVDRLHRLINDVLDFSKLEAGKIDLHIQDGDLIETVKEVVIAQESVAKDKGITLRYEVKAEVPKIGFDPDRISQVLMNLVNNAIKFTSKGGVTVVVTKDDFYNTINVTVEDTGEGIRSSDIPKLFGQFTQLGGLKDRKTGGTGLGLAISKQIINAHNGHIWVESEFGKGSRFSFSLPADRGKI